MFDVRPVNDAGDLDLDLMNQIKRRKQIDLRLVGRTETQAGPMGISGLRKFVDPRDAEIRRFQKMIYAEKDKQKAIQSRRNSGTMADVSMTQDVSVLPARNGKLADKRLDRSNSHNARLVVDKPVTARNKVEFVRPSVSRPAICRPLLNRPTFDHSVSDIKVADRSRVAFEKPSASRVANPEIAKKRVENIQPSIEKPTITRLAINDPITDIQAINVRVAGNHRPAVNREVKNEAVSPRRISSETKPVRPAIKRTVFNSADIRKDEQFIRVNTVNHSGRIPKKDIIPDPILAKKVFEAGIPLEKVAIRADKSAIEAARRKEQVEKKKARKNYLRKIITAPLGVLKNKIGSKISSLSSGFSQFTDSFKEPTILNREERAFFRKKSFSFFALATSIFVLIFGTSFIYRGISIKNQTLDNSKIAYASLLQAKSGIENKDFTGASMKFSEAYDKFDQINRDIESLGGLIVESSRFIPYLSKLSSGAYLSKSGEDISRIGILITDTMKILNEVKNPLGKDESTVSYLKIFQETDKNVTETAALVDDLNQNLDKVNVDDIPEEHREQFVSLKQQLPEMNNFISNLSQEEKIFTDVLGGNGPRKYLFLFQNNQEMRATGGFIGTYAVLDIFDGNVKSFFVDGIFNPDGQL